MESIVRELFLEDRARLVIYESLAIRKLLAIWSLSSIANESATFFIIFIRHLVSYL
jgi:hypothetical protein